MSPLVSLFDCVSFIAACPGKDVDAVVPYLLPLHTQLAESWAHNNRVIKNKHQLRGDSSACCCGRKHQYTRLLACFSVLLYHTLDHFVVAIGRVNTAVYVACCATLLASRLIEIWRCGQVLLEAAVSSPPCMFPM